MALDKDKYRLTHISGELLLSYKEGRCSDHDMHEIERHLLDCELCQDALEGYELFHSKVIQSDLEILQSRLNSRTQPKKETWKHLSVAASLLLLMTIGWVLFPTSEDTLVLEKQIEESSEVKQDSIEIAKPEKILSEKADEFAVDDEEIKLNAQEEKFISQEQKPITSPEPTSMPKKSKVETTKKEFSEVVSEKEVGDEFLAFAAEEEVFEDQGFGDEDRILIMENPSLEDVPIVAFSEEEVPEEEGPTELEEVVIVGYGTQRKSDITGAIATVDADAAKKSKKEERRAKKARNKSDPMQETAKEESEEDQNYRANMKATGAVTRATSAGHTVYGRIVDAEDGYEIPGVTILIKNSTIGTVSNIEGYYMLEVPSVDDVLVFSFVGYMTYEVEVGGRQEINATLDLDVEALEEVVVIGYGTSRRHDETYTVPNITQARPPGGFSEYKKAIRKNLEYPDEAMENEIEGKVRLKFSVGSGGNVRDIEVLKSLGYGCDEEAIRLIKELGDWSPGQRDGVNIDMPVTYTIRFKLP